jgi:hypothetical protein
MASAHQLELLRRSVADFNAWRRTSGEAIDLRGADLRGAELGQANLVGAMMGRAKLDGADLWMAELEGADLHLAALPETRLESANLIDADLNSANLRQADLTSATLGRAVLKMANLAGATFAAADLSGTDLSMADVTRTSFAGATFSRTLLCSLDLRSTLGLDRAIHRSPSSIGVDTILMSSGGIPQAFLRGCGLPDDLIAYSNGLSLNPLQFYSCFISHSTRDQAFADRLHADLQSKGVRCWYAPQDLRIGADIREGIDQSIRVHDKVLIVISESSIESDWVAQEVNLAFNKESETRKQVLFPIRLDDAVLTAAQSWAARIRNERQVGNFSAWKHHDSYSQAFDRLIRDLRADPDEPLPATTEAVPT